MERRAEGRGEEGREREKEICLYIQGEDGLG